ncbi:MAG TPA: helix-turn-helix domain-containing protein [Roseiarcus sp.]|jgi:putative transcriptional regulator
MQKLSITDTIRPRHAPAESLGESSNAAGPQAAQLASTIKALRRATGLTQEEFCARFRIPLGTLRDWEQGRSEPDKPARAYLTAIAGDAAAVSRALEMGAH